MTPRKPPFGTRPPRLEVPTPVNGWILLVDDHPVFRREFRACFEEYEIIEADNGADALEILRMPNEVDLVILDYVMPGLDGIRVLEEIRKADPRVGIIIQTGHGSKELMLKAFRGKVNDYIEKPLKVDETRRIIERVLETCHGLPELNESDGKGKVERVKRFVGRNYFRKIRLKDAAAVVCLSPKYLSRLFSRETGMPFEDYLLRLKMAKAKELLDQTALTVDQVTARLGYANSESFTRQFKKRTGLTPSGYRRRKPGMVR